MQVTNISLTQGGPPQAGTGQRDIVSAVDVVPGRRVFRHVWFVRFNTGGLADRLAVDAGATDFRVSFRPYDYNAVSPGVSALVASLSTLDGGVVVTLDAPRRVQKAQMASAKAPDSSYVVELFRVDGNRLADAPTVSAGQNTAVTSDFTDMRFTVKLKRPDGSYASLGTSDLQELTVRSSPGAVRLGLAAPDSLGAPAFFWPGADAGGALEGVDVGHALASALQQYADGLDSPLPAIVDVALVAEADGPCVLDVAAFSISYHLVLESFYLDGQRDAQKQVLRFPGGQTVSRQLWVRLPAQASIVSATMRADESFSRDRPPAEGALSVAGGPPSGNEGVFVGADRWVAQAVSPARALSASGVALGVVSLATKTQLLVELREDWHGQPLGKALAGGTLSAEQAGQRTWATLAFQQPVVLPAQPCWVLAKAASGSAVWLTTPAEGTIGLLEAGDGQMTDSIQGASVLCQLVAHGKQAEGQKALAVSVGETTAVAADEPAGTWDLTEAFTAYLSGKMGPDPVDVPVTFETGLRGLASVPPLTVLYDIVV